VRACGTGTTGATPVSSAALAGERYRVAQLLSVLFHAAAPSFMDSVTVMGYAALYFITTDAVSFSVVATSTRSK